MTKVLLVIGDARKADIAERAEADMVIELNEECSAGKVVKDRYGKPMPVKVIS